MLGAMPQGVDLEAALSALLVLGIDRTLAREQLETVPDGD